MITEEIVINGNSSGAVQATNTLQKEISNLKKDLGLLERGTKEYESTFSKLSDKMKEQNTRMQDLRKSAGQSGVRGEITKLKLQLDGLTTGTKEYNQVAYKLSTLMKEQSDRMQYLKSSSADFGDVMQNITVTAGGLVGAFNVISGTMGLFAGESEEVQQAMLKVQQGMMIVQGLYAMDEGIKGFRRLTANLKGYMNNVKQAGDTMVATSNTASQSEFMLTSASQSTAAAQSNKGVEGVKANEEIRAANLETALLEERQREKTLDGKIKLKEAEAKQLSNSITTHKEMYDLQKKYGDEYIAEQMKNSQELLEAKLVIVNKELTALEEEKVANSEAIVEKIKANTKLGETIDKNTTKQKKSWNIFKKKNKEAVDGTVELDKGVKKTTSSFKTMGLAIAKSLGVFVLITGAIWLATKGFELLMSKTKKAEEAQAELIASNEELAKSIGSGSGGLMAKFKILQKGWNDLNGSTEKQSAFLKKYANDFKDVFGENKKSLKDYNDYFNKYSENIIKGYLLQAKAAAYTQKLQKNLEREIELKETKILPDKKSSSMRRLLGDKYSATLDAKNVLEKEQARDEELLKLKASNDQLLKDIVITAKEREDLLVGLGLNSIAETSVNIAGTTIVIKTIAELEAQYLQLLEKNRVLARDNYQEDMTANEKYYTDLQKQEALNYDKLYVGTQKYYDNLYRIKSENISRIRDLEDEEAQRVYDNSIAEVDNQIDNIKGNAGERSLNKEELELIGKLQDEKLKINDNYNTTLQNNNIKYNESIRVNDEEKYSNDLNALIKYYTDRLDVIDKFNVEDSEKITKLNNKLKGELIQQGSLSLFQMLLGGDTKEMEQQVAEYNKNIDLLTSTQINNLKKLAVLQDKMNDEGLSLEERQKAEEAYNNIIEENSDIQTEILQNKADKMKAINDEIIKDMVAGVEGLKSTLSNVSQIYDSYLERDTNNLNQKLETSIGDITKMYNQGLISKEDYDAKMLANENDYNNEVYKLQVEHLEKQKQMQIFQTIIETLSSAVKSYSSLSSIPFVGPVLGGIAAASALAMGYAQVQAIKSQRIDNPNSGVLGVSALATDSALNSNLIYQSANLQGSNEKVLNNMNNQKIFVSVTDINNAQNRVKVVDKNSTF